MATLPTNGNSGWHHITRPESGTTAFRYSPKALTQVRDELKKEKPNLDKRISVRVPQVANPSHLDEEFLSIRDFTTGTASMVRYALKELRHDQMMDELKIIPVSLVLTLIAEQVISSINETVSSTDNLWKVLAIVLVTGVVSTIAHKLLTERSKSLAIKNTSRETGFTAEEIQSFLKP